MAAEVFTVIASRTLFIYRNDKVPTIMPQPLQTDQNNSCCLCDPLPLQNMSDLWDAFFVFEYSYSHLSSA